MFLSRMGGTGKSEVIKAFVEFARGISMNFWMELRHRRSQDYCSYRCRSMPNSKWEDTSQYSMSVFYKNWKRKHTIMEINKSYSN